MVCERCVRPGVQHHVCLAPGSVDTGDVVAGLQTAQQLSHPTSVLMFVWPEQDV